MEYAESEGGAGGISEEWDEDIVGVLVGEEPHHFVGFELGEDLTSGLAAGDNFGSGGAADVVDDPVDAFVVSITGDGTELVTVEAEPCGHSFPVPEVSGDENDAFAGGEGCVEVFDAEDFGV